MPAARYGRRCASAVGIPLAVLAVLGALQPGVLAFVQQGLPRLAPRACARVGALCCRAAGDETTRPAAAPLSRRDTVVGAAALLLAPLPSSAAKARKASNGKWAQHYDEFTDEDLEGFSETESGLQYKDVEEGTGATPQKGQGVYVHYSGYLLDSGNLFDSSYERGKPLQFAVGTGRVIKGWDEALQTMKVGGRRVLIIPAKLGYGSKAVGPITPNSDLVFYVELVSLGS